MEYPRTSLSRFFVVSLSLHLLIILSWPKSPEKPRTPEAISVAFLPAPQEKVVKQPAVPKSAPTRPSRAPAQIAKKTTPLPVERTDKLRASPPPKKESTIPQEAIPSPQETKPKIVPKPEPPRIAEPPRLPEEEFTIVERSLPTLKELLPPVTWSASRERNSKGDGPVRLDTREPQYVTYFTSIKQAIELLWQYPEPALRYGLQGKLLLEFTVLKNGELERARLIRSSGFAVLDEEALRAVKAASPFHPIPPWIGKTRLDIIASFEYLDNRLNYHFIP